MKHAFNKFSRENIFGGKGEVMVRRWFMELGFAVLPLSLIENGGAPMFESDVAKLISPDILACRNGLSVLVDVKSKGRLPRYRVGQRMQTGIELRQHDSYMAVQKATGMRTALCFIHADRPEMYLGFLDEIEADAQRFLRAQQAAMAGCSSGSCVQGGHDFLQHRSESRKSL